MQFIKPFAQLTIEDIPLVGGKNASIGQMMQELGTKGIRIPDGFAITADAYWYHLDHHNLRNKITALLDELTDPNDLEALKRIGSQIRSLIAEVPLAPDLADEITQAYTTLCKQYEQNECDVAVRSSATAEDLPHASFAGQQETFLNIRGPQALLEACVHSMASLFTNRAIAYRIEHGFEHMKVALSVGVQKMIRADKACSGTAFSLDTETGFADVMLIDAAYGLGETIVQGIVVPDEYTVHKPTLLAGKTGIIRKRLGSKDVKAIYSDDPKEPIKQVPVSAQEQTQWCLSDNEVRELAHHIITIEQHYSDVRGNWCPMDIEWAKDGIDNKLYILQARPETVHSQKKFPSFITYAIDPNTSRKTLVTGQSIGQQIAHGTARVVSSAADIDVVQPGDIIITQMTDPDWVPAMKRAAGIITEQGGRTCHAAIVSRELGIPAIVGAESAQTKLAHATAITIDCSQGTVGHVYEGHVPFKTDEVRLDTLKEPPVNLMVNIADPESAFRIAQLPVSGVGLARIEFIIGNNIGVHPMALIEPERLHQSDRQKLEAVTTGYENPTDFFIEKLARGIATIAAAFAPRPVIVRLSDFKTNEYRTLLGGTVFEPEEHNPMLGFRGASRYTHPLFEHAFALECKAFTMAREQMGFENITLMVPFVRTMQEAQHTLEAMAQHGLKRGQNGLEIYMMVEIPSNVLLIDKFAQLFDGFSIGSNDLTQLTLGIDRDSQLLAGSFDERDPAVKAMLQMAIEGANKAKTPIGLCGQAPSDHPDIAQFLIDCGITSISLNPDSVLPFLMR